MPSPTEVQVKSDPSPTQSKGDWIVKIGRGQGGSVHSRHRLKSAAIKEARQQGRKRKDQDGGAILRVQNQKGHWKTEAEYGTDGSAGSRFGFFKTVKKIARGKKG